jgi:peptide/nickel transport system permease protein/oligopeptide transport system permease protein
MIGGDRYLLFSSPHVVVFPGIAITMTVLAFNLVGDGLRDALDPRLQR